MLSRELKEQLKLNNERKARLAAVVEKQLQFEQYQQVLDMLDSQVDQIYVKHHVRFVLDMFLSNFSTNAVVLYSVRRNQNRSANSLQL
jgi:Histone acetyltransferases subunit 3